MAQPQLLQQLPCSCNGAPWSCSILCRGRSPAGRDPGHTAPRSHHRHLTQAPSLLPEVVLVYLACILMGLQGVAAQSGTCSRSQPVMKVSSWRDSNLDKGALTPKQATAMRSLVSGLSSNGFPDQAPTQEAKVLMQDTDNKLSIVKESVSVAYSDSGTVPLTDSTGKPIKFVRVTVKAGTGADSVDIASVDVPAGYKVDAGAIRDALVTSSETVRGQTVLPAKAGTNGGPSFRGIPKDYTPGPTGGTGGGTTPGGGSGSPSGGGPDGGGSTVPEAVQKAWSTWEGSMSKVSSSGGAGSGEISFDENGEAFTTRDSAITSNPGSEAASVVEGFPVELPTDPQQGSPGGGGPGGTSTRQCRRRLVAGKYRYYCKKTSTH